MLTRAQSNRLNHAATSAKETPLSPHWAFVVQFRASATGQVYEGGRVEHLVSGQMTRFQSLEELTVYFARALDEASKGAEVPSTPES